MNVSGILRGFPYYTKPHFGGIPSAEVCQTNVFIFVTISSEYSLGVSGNFRLRLWNTVPEFSSVESDPQEVLGCPRKLVNAS